MRYKLIACEVLFRELCHVVARSPHQIDFDFLPKGLHDLGASPMCERLQAVLDTVDESRYSGVLLGYALCNNGICGLTARGIPVVVPRAHDCITLFLGSKERYHRYFMDNPGVYFKTTGWMERGETTGELSQITVQRKTGMDSSYEDLVAKYGEENAKYLYETLCETTRNYSQFTFIEMGVEPDGSFEQKARDDAADRGWRFAKEPGDLRLFEALVNGPPWDTREFLVVEPGYRVTTGFDEGIITTEPVGQPMGCGALRPADVAPSGRTVVTGGDI
jgi:hypothetical protein